MKKVLEAMRRTSYAQRMGALILLLMEECALGMGQRRNYAAVKDAQIKCNGKECARGMGGKSQMVQQRRLKSS